jgi:cell wall-associated NlpC family hydrolase
MTDRRLTPQPPEGATPRPMQVRAGVVSLRPRPGPDVGIDTELVFGERVICFAEDDGYAYVQSQRDGYVGYVAADALIEAGATATHRVSALRTYVYSGPSIKLPEPLLIPEGAEVSVVGEEKDFFKLDGGGYLFKAHLSPVDHKAADYVAIAERYLGAPYLWGGRTSLGLDCSGLVQTALRMAGVPAPRDSDMLERYFPVALAITPAFEGLKRGDAVFWKGHVGLMRDQTTLLHANGHHMAVASEPLKEAAARILEKSFGPVTSIRRLA